MGLCLACENLVGFSTAQPELFKRHQLLPVRDLKLLVRDYTVRILRSLGTVTSKSRLTDLTLDFAALDIAYRKKCSYNIN